MDHFQDLEVTVPSRPAHPNITDREEEYSNGPCQLTWARRA
jgi:hypothetical protein